MKSQAFHNASMDYEPDETDTEDRSLDLRDIVSACALCWILDPSNREFYRDRFRDMVVTYWPGLFAEMNTDDWGGSVPQGSAFFHTILAFDIMYYDFPEEDRDASWRFSSRWASGIGRTCRGGRSTTTPVGACGPCSRTIATGSTSRRPTIAPWWTCSCRATGFSVVVRATRAPVWRATAMPRPCLSMCSSTPARTTTTTIRSSSSSPSGSLATPPRPLAAAYALAIRIPTAHWRRRAAGGARSQVYRRRRGLRGLNSQGLSPDGRLLEYLGMPAVPIDPVRPP